MARVFFGFACAPPFIKQALLATLAIAAQLIIHAEFYCHFGIANGAWACVLPTAGFDGSLVYFMGGIPVMAG